MSNTFKPKQLLVEGEHDRLFIEACCEKIKLGYDEELKRVKTLKDDVQIGPPKSHGGMRNGKNNGIDILPKLIKQIPDGKVTHLGLVIDADFDLTDGLGFRKTLQKVVKMLSEHNYQIPREPNTAINGFFFPHPDGFRDIGLWIMPDNCSDGMLEDFIKTSIKISEEPLLKIACQTVGDLPNPKFKDHHRSKAEVATWMAWQATPGQGLNGAVGAQLLDFENGLALKYIEWLKKVFI